MATITESLIESGKSDNGAWSMDQLAIIGVEWPPLKGWKKQVVGKHINDNDAERFVKIKNLHLKNQHDQKQLNLEL